MIRDTPQTKKKTTRTGRRIGMKDRCRVSISINDPDRNFSRLWEHLKKIYSRKKITAAELGAKMCFLGAMSLLEEREAEYQRTAERVTEEQEARQETFDFR